MASEGDVLGGGRFVVVRAGLGAPVLAEDRERGGRVEVIQTPYWTVAHRAAVEAMQARVEALADPRLVPARSLSPMVVPCAGDDATGPSSAAEVASAALDLMAIVEVALRERIELDPDRAWMTTEGVRVPAPAPALYWRRWAVDGAEPEAFRQSVWRWYRRQRRALEDRSPTWTPPASERRFAA